MLSGDKINIWLQRIIYTSVGLSFVTILLIDKSYLFPFISSKVFVFRILIEIALAAYIILALRLPEVRPKMSKISWALLIYVGVLLVSSLLGENLFKSLWGTVERGEGFLTLIHLFALFIILIGILRSPKGWLRLIGFSFAISLVVSLYALGQFFGLEAFINTTGTRLSGTVGNASFLAGYLLMNAWLGLYLLVQAKQKYWRYLLGIGVALEVFIVFQTQTRGAIIALVLGTLFLLLIGTRRAGSQRGRAFSVLAVVLIIGASAATFAFKETPLVQGNQILRRIASISPDSITGQSRLLTWQASLEAFSDKPVLGWGYENYNYAFDRYFPTPIYIDNGSQIWFDRAHNVVFEHLVSFGSLGLLAYVYLLVVATRTLLRLVRKRAPEERWPYYVLLGLLGAYVVQNLFVFDTLPTYMVLFMLLAYLHFLERSSLPLQGGERGGVVNRLQKLAVPISLIVLILLGLGAYHFNIKPAQANLQGADALRLIREGRLGDSVELLKGAISLNTYQSDELRQQWVNRMLDERGSLRAQPEAGTFAYTEAAKQVEALLASDPENSENYLLALGVMNVADGAGLVEFSLENILEATDRAKELAPARTHIYYESAQAYLNHNQFVEALAELEIARELSPQVGAVYFNFMLVEARRENWVATREWLEFVLDSANQVVMTDHDRDRIINLFAEARRFEDLIFFYNELTRLRPSNAAYWQQLAAVYGEIGDVTNGRAAAMRAAQIDPSLQAAAQAFIELLESGQLPSVSGDGAAGN